jgi:pimeloyl-ACP methyl ester carboxylesterase
VREKRRPLHGPRSENEPACSLCPDILRARLPLLVDVSRAQQGVSVCVRPPTQQFRIAPLPLQDPIFTRRMADRDARLLPPHIVVLVHGNNGSPADFDAVERALGVKFGGEQLLVVKSSANHQSTSLGVEIGGTRLAKEIADAVLAFDLDPRVSRYKLSMVGHSLGGLYARFAVVQLMDALSMLNMDYVSFVTICTPHLGSRRARGPSTIKVRSGLCCEQ